VPVSKFRDNQLGLIDRGSAGEIGRARFNVCKNKEPGFFIVNIPYYKIIKNLIILAMAKIIKYF